MANEGLNLHRLYARAGLPLGLERFNLFQREHLRQVGEFMRACVGARAGFAAYDTLPQGGFYAAGERGLVAWAAATALAPSEPSLEGRGELEGEPYWSLTSLPASDQPQRYVVGAGDPEANAGSDLSPFVLPYASFDGLQVYVGGIPQPPANYRVYGVTDGATPAGMTPLESSPVAPHLREAAIDAGLGLLSFLRVSAGARRSQDLSAGGVGIYRLPDTPVAEQPPVLWRAAPGDPWQVATWVDSPSPQVGEVAVEDPLTGVLLAWAPGLEFAAPEVLSGVLNGDNVTFALRYANLDPSAPVVLGLIEYNAGGDYTFRTLAPSEYSVYPGTGRVALAVPPRPGDLVVALEYTYMGVPASHHPKEWANSVEVEIFGPRVLASPARAGRHFTAALVTCEEPRDLRTDIFRRPVAMYSLYRARLRPFYTDGLPEFVPGAPVFSAPVGAGGVLGERADRLYLVPFLTSADLVIDTVNEGRRFAKDHFAVPQGGLFYACILDRHAELTEISATIAEGTVSSPLTLQLRVDGNPVGSVTIDNNNSAASQNFVFNASANQVITVHASQAEPTAAVALLLRGKYAIG